MQLYAVSLRERTESGSTRRLTVEIHDTEDVAKKRADAYNKHEKLPVLDEQEFKTWDKFPIGTLYYEVYPYKLNETLYKGVI